MLVKSYNIFIFYPNYRCVPVLESLAPAPVSGERVAPSSLYDHNDSGSDLTDDTMSSLSSLEATITDERTEIILAATFLLIVILSFMA